MHTNVAPLMCNLLTSPQSLQVTVGSCSLFIHDILYCKIWVNGCLQLYTLLAVICTLNVWIHYLFYTDWMSNNMWHDCIPLHQPTLHIIAVYEDERSRICKRALFESIRNGYKNQRWCCNSLFLYEIIYGKNLKLCNLFLWFLGVTLP